MSVKRVFVEKKPEYAIKARELREEIESYLDITGVTGVRVLVRYDIENISEDVYKEALVPVVDSTGIITIYLTQGKNGVYNDGKTAAKYQSSDNGSTWKYIGQMEIKD